MSNVRKIISQLFLQNFIKPIGWSSSWGSQLSVGSWNFSNRPWKGWLVRQNISEIRNNLQQILSHKNLNQFCRLDISNFNVPVDEAKYTACWQIVRQWIWHKILLHWIEIWPSYPQLNGRSHCLTELTKNYRSADIRSEVDFFWRT